MKKVYVYNVAQYEKYEKWKMMENLYRIHVFRLFGCEMFLLL
jgi:hypothetical protein